MKAYRVKITPRFKLANGKFANGKAETNGAVKFLFQIESDYPFAKNTKWVWTVKQVFNVGYNADNYGQTIFVGFDPDSMNIDTIPNTCFKVKGSFEDDGFVKVSGEREGIEIDHKIDMATLLAARNDTHALAVNYREISITVEDEEPGEEPPIVPPIVPPIIPPPVTPPNDGWLGSIMAYFKKVFDKAVLITIGVLFVIGFILGAILL